MRSVRWRAVQHGGLEQLVLARWDDVITARSTVIGRVADRPFGLFYQLNFKAGWTAPLLQVQRTDGVVMTLATDGEGNWRDTFAERPDLAGCVDIDFEVTPFTNTLPILRAPLAIGETRRFRMAYVPADTLEPFPDEQIYTRLDTGLYRVERADGSFSARITVDAEGVVIDYPKLFQRVDI